MKTKPLKEPNVDPAVLTRPKKAPVKKDEPAKAPVEEPLAEPVKPAPTPPPSPAPTAPPAAAKKTDAEEPKDDVIEEIEQMKQDLIKETTVGPAPKQSVTAPPAEPEREESAEPAEPVESVPPKPTQVPVAPAGPATPGGHVTGKPAMPSSPAYYDATGGAATQAVDDLSREADQAYRDRDYSRAEKACLKILMRDPKNHKYMTRIGQVYQEMGQLDDAKEAYEAAKVLDPKNFFVLNRLSEVTRQLDEKGSHVK